MDTKSNCSYEAQVSSLSVKFPTKRLVLHPVQPGEDIIGGASSEQSAGIRRGFLKRTV